MDGNRHEQAIEVLSGLTCVAARRLSRQDLQAILDVYDFHDDRELAAGAIAQLPCVIARRVSRQDIEAILDARESLCYPVHFTAARMLVWCEQNQIGLLRADAHVRLSSLRQALEACPEGRLALQLAESS